MRSLSLDRTTRSGECEWSSAAADRGLETAPVSAMSVRSTGTVIHPSLYSRIYWVTAMRRIRPKRLVMKWDTRWALSHDGRTSPNQAYYAGSGSGATGWAPIMGNGYSKELTQWSRGEYNNASNLQDDLFMITNFFGFGYRSDDHSDVLSSATALLIDQGTVSGSGIIERNDDFDLFSFVTEGGEASIDLTPLAQGANLDIGAALLDAAGTLIVSSNPIGSLAANLTATLAAGQYFVQVTGVGEGDPASGGYSDYGSLGQYWINGSVASGPANDAPPPTMTASRSLRTVVSPP